MHINNENSTRIAYIHFAKAFDTVCHSKLLYKLSNLGIREPLFDIIASFLSNRSQQVVIDNCLSNSSFVRSGVAQGSVLGPLLFVIYINDLAECIPTGNNIRLFADDVKLYSEIKCKLDIANFQESIDTLTTWSKSWQLNISIKKCFTMDITSKRRSVAYNSNCV